MKTAIKLENLTKVGLGSPLNINWELVSNCQYKCTYCYYKPFESNTDYVSLSALVTKKISTIKDLTKVTLLGGEPSLHPDFHLIVQTLHSFKHVTLITIVTNFDKPLEYWLKLLAFRDKVKIVVSLHMEYPKKDTVGKINFLQNHFSMDLVFVVHNDLKFLPKMINLAHEIFEISNEDVSINFVRIHDKGEGIEAYRTYPPQIEEFLFEQNQKLLLRQSTERVNVLVDNEWQSVEKFNLINGNFNQFKGWSCQLRAFIIHEDGMVSSACSQIKKHILLQDFKATILKCTYRICECDDYWEFPKEKLNVGIK